MGPATLDNGLVKTPSLNLVVDAFQHEIDAIIATWRVQAGHKGVLGAATIYSASAAALTNCATQWEYFRSEWHKKAIARDATQYRAELVRRVKTFAAESAGGNDLVAALRDAGLEIEINLPKNPTIGTVSRLRDTREQNVSFRTQKESDTAATRDLVPTYAALPKSLSRDDWLVLEILIAVRNALAHASPRSIDAMNTALSSAAKVRGASNIRSLARLANRVTSSGIGKYLAASVSWDAGEEARVIAICRYVRVLGDKFRV